MTWGDSGPAADPMLRSYLYEAAGTILTRSARWSRLKACGLRLHKRAGFKRAAVAVARKPATIMHAVWSDGREFVYGAEPTKATAIWHAKRGYPVPLRRKAPAGTTVADVVAIVAALRIAWQ